MRIKHIDLGSDTDLGTIIKVDQNEHSMIATTDEGYELTISDQSFEMMFAVYTEGYSMTVEQWKEWAANQ